MIREDTGHRSDEVGRAAFDAKLTGSGVVRILSCGRTVRNLEVVDQPIHDGAGFFGNHLDEDRVIAVFADMHDVFICEFRRVLGFFHDFALIAGTRCNQRTGIQNRIAAEVRHFFNQDCGIAV